MDIRIPQLADNVTSATVVKVLVKEGDTIKKGQDVIELETEKAVAGIPSTADGKVTRVLVKEGDSVKVGQAVVSVDGPPAGRASAASPREEAPPPPFQESQPRSGEARSAELPPPPPGFEPPAPPSVRKLAQEIGIDLRKVRGSEHGGRITAEDLRAYVRGLERLGASGAASGPTGRRPGVEAVDFSKWGPVRRQPMSPLRKKIAERMTLSWTTVPHVTQFDEADVTELVAAMKKSVIGKQGVKITMTGLMARVLVPLLKQHAVFNSSMDEARGEIVFKEYYHFGLAVDTEQGLIVPVLKNVDKKNLVELSKEISALAERTKARKVSLEELQGGTFTISNQGGIGGGHFTPIINVPEVAILGVGRGAVKVTPKGERMILPLALSYDHRVIDGASAARFIRDLVAGLENFPLSELNTKK